MEQEILYGVVTAVVYQNPENGYAVLRFRTQEGETVTVVGTIPMTAAGERLAVTGRWTAHASYGRQFEAELLERYLPESRDEILSYLSSRAIKGVGERTAQRIVAAFGEKSLEVLENEPDRLAQVPGISASKAREISENFRRQVGMRRLIEFLAQYHLPAALALRLYRAYGEVAVDAVQEEPYMLLQPYYGASFGQVDQFALAMGFETDDPQRVEAGVLFELTYNLSGGHVFIPREKLIDATARLLGLPGDTVAAAITSLTETDRLAVDTVAGLTACYLPELHEAEVYLARRFQEMAANPPAPPEKLAQYLAELQEESAVTYADKQLEAIRAAAENRVILVTGGPGTGKTTTMAGILALFDKLKLKTMLAAPTGRAAKRLSECTGREASTIHRLLESQFDAESGAMCFFHNEEAPLKADALVVDETSMVDLPLMQSLLLALKPRCRLVLVGDPDQLPSVGPGNVFSDLIRSGIVPTVRLTEIFRQARESLIVMNAHAINQGQLPELTSRSRDFFFLKRRTAETVTETIQDLCARRLPQNMGIAPGDIQVLSPTRKGECGTRNLNKLLQAVLNPPGPGKREKSYGDFSFREGDRVMQIRNNYDILWKKRDGTGQGVGIFNGDVGQILTVDHAEEQVTVAFDDRVAQYDFAMLSELEPAYAMTVHKSQGSEYRAVILTAWQGSPYLLTRSVLYTAVTRAKELLIAVGDENVIAAMTCNDRQTRRYSGLKLRLQGKVGP